jgi:uncharacterized damage-inducible protein DinB
MTPQEVLAQTYQTSSMVLTTYISDLSDADLLHRPGVGCNHLNWQLGHLISSEVGLLEMVVPGAGAKLPPGFAEKYKKDAAANDDVSAFANKEELTTLINANQEAALKAFASVSDEQLSQPGPPHMQPMFPTVGSILILVATHGLMHCGQFVPVRRALGKPVLI